MPTYYEENLQSLLALRQAYLDFPSTQVACLDRRLAIAIESDDDSCDDYQEDRSLLPEGLLPFKNLIDSYTNILFESNALSNRFFFFNYRNVRTRVNRFIPRTSIYDYGTLRQWYFETNFLFDESFLLKVSQMLFIQGEKPTISEKILSMLIEQRLTTCLKLILLREDISQWRFCLRLATKCKIDSQFLGDCLVEKLTKEGEGLSSVLPTEFSFALLHAASLGASEKVNALLDLGARSQNTKDSNGNTVLHYAVLYHEMLQHLLEKDETIEVSTTNTSGITAEEYGAMHGAIEDALTLLKDCRIPPSEEELLLRKTKKEFDAMEKRRQASKEVLRLNEEKMRAEQDAISDEQKNLEILKELAEMELTKIALKTQRANIEAENIAALGQQRQAEQKLAQALLEQQDLANGTLQTQKGLDQARERFIQDKRTFLHAASCQAKEKFRQNLITNVTILLSKFTPSSMSFFSDNEKIRALNLVLSTLENRNATAQQLRNALHGLNNEKWKESRAVTSIISLVEAFLEDVTVALPVEAAVSRNVVAGVVLSYF